MVLNFPEKKEKKKHSSISVNRDSKSMTMRYIKNMGNEIRKWQKYAIRFLKKCNFGWQLWIYFPKVGELSTVNGQLKVSYSLAGSIPRKHPELPSEILFLQKTGCRFFVIHYNVFSKMVLTIMMVYFGYTRECRRGINVENAFPKKVEGQVIWQMS